MTLDKLSKLCDLYIEQATLLEPLQAHLKTIGFTIIELFKAGGGMTSYTTETGNRLQIINGQLVVSRVKNNKGKKCRKMQKS